MPTRFVILTIILFVFSCSNSKKSRKADSNFFAYYNSFFIAEKSFNEAIEDIESMEEVDGNISSKAKNLFEEAIKNALIIEKDFYQTKYLDDAYFILGKSSYFINRLTSSKYYFNRLKNEFPNSEFLEEVLIWLSYVDLEIGYIDQVKEDLLLYKANYNQMNNSKKYLTDLLFAKVANYEDEINDEKVHYISAITHSINKYQKLFLYRKLLLIAEYEKNYAEAILYINYIEKNSDNNLSENLLEKWFLYNRLLANHDDVLNKINKKIDGELSPIDYIYYKIEKSKTFLDKNEIDKSINVLNEIIDKYKEDNTYKNKLGEAYLLLGEIYLKYFNDINIAKEKFELCKEVSSSSTTYNKKSKKYIESILNFESLVHEIEYLSQTDNEESIISDKSDDENIADEHQDFNTFMLPMPADSTNNIEIDSLLFKIAQLLYFDLEMKNSANIKFEEIIEKFPLSMYGYRSLIALNSDSPNDILTEKIQNHPLNLNKTENIQNENGINNKRKKALDLLSISPLEAQKKLLELNLEYDDSESLYFAGYISENFLSDIENAVKIYQDYLEKYAEDEYVSKINLKISKIETMLKNEIKNLRQKINYRISWQWINNNKLDSAIYYLNLTFNGPNLSLKSYSELLSSSIEKYEENIIILNNYENVTNDLDSLKLNIAHFLYKDINFDKEASEYYKNIANNSKILNYVHSSLAALSIIEPEEKWDSTLFTMLNDSSMYNMEIHNALKNEPYNLKGTMNSDSSNFVWYNKLNMILFPEVEKIENTDSVKINQEHNKGLNNINNVQ